MISLSLVSIVKNYIETARKSDDELTILTISVSAAAFTARHIVYPISPFYLKRDFLKLFHYRQIATGVKILRQLY